MTQAERSLSSSACARSHRPQDALTCGLSNGSHIRCAPEPGRTETQTETPKITGYESGVAFLPCHPCESPGPMHTDDTETDVTPRP